MTAQLTIDVLEERALRVFQKRRRFPTSAVRAILQAQRLLGLAFGLEIAERRSEEEPLQRAFGQAKLNGVLLRAFTEVAMRPARLVDFVKMLAKDVRTRRSFGTASCGSEGFSDSLNRRSHVCSGSLLPPSLDGRPKRVATRTRPP